MKRVVTAFFLVPAAVYSVLFAPWQVFLAVAALIALLCFREYSAITGAFAPIGYVAGILLLLAPPRETTLILFLTALAAMCLPLFAGNLERAVAQAGALALGVLYIFGSWKTAILLHDINPHWLMFGMLVNWIGDTGAYYVGRRYGKHKLAPNVSPGKTWEGAAASSVTGIIFGIIYVPLVIPGISVLIVALLALVANAAGQIGDLAESAIKRAGGVKDSGTILPGHGGMLDRVDSTMFALPVLYTLVSLLKSGL